MAEASMAVSTVVTHILPNRNGEKRRKKRYSNDGTKTNTAKNNEESASSAADGHNIRTFECGNGYGVHMLEQTRGSVKSVSKRRKLQKDNEKHNANSNIEHQNEE